jgi:transposase
VPDTRVLDVTIKRDEESDTHSIFIKVEATKAKRQRCGSCGRKTRRTHGARELRCWRHLGLFGIPVFIESTNGRVVCSRCGVRTASVPWARVGSHFTRAFEDEVAWFLQRTNQTATAEHFGISWPTAGNIASRVVAEKLDGSLLDDLRSIGVDEISYGRPKKFLTVVVDHHAGRVVWAAEGKSGDTLDEFFALLGPEKCALIETITMDMAAGYEASVKRSLPGAKVVYDRFHVVRLVLDAVDDVRRAEERRLVGEGTEESEAERVSLKRSRFALLKNPWTLKRKERQKLSEIQQNNAMLYRAYLLKESFQAIYDSTTEEEAEERFAEWYRWARRSRLQPFMRVAATIRSRWEGIKAFLTLRITNAGVEGYNSKIRMVSHRAFGFHSAGALIAMLMLVCSGISLTPVGHG